MKNVIFLGTSNFAVPCLRALCVSDDLRPVLVITQPDRPKGRGYALSPTPVKIEAQKLGIPILQPLHVKDILGEIKKYAPHVMVLVAYGQIIPKEFIALARYGIVNVHPSLLPKYRGASPIQSAILHGDVETGASLMLLDQELDHGPLIAQERMAIQPEHNALTLEVDLAKLSAQLLLRELPNYLLGDTAPKEQNHSEASYTLRMKREDGKLDFSKSAGVLSRWIRAYKGWPETYADLQNKTGTFSKKCKILAATALSCSSVQSAYGSLFLNNEKQLAAVTGEGCLCITELQVEGKKKVSAQEFCAGYNPDEYRLL
jgi:methionyl-tRNA formyltransferase